jgi:hypothetical protein
MTTDDAFPPEWTADLPEAARALGPPLFASRVDPALGRQVLRAGLPRLRLGFGLLSLPLLALLAAGSLEALRHSIAFVLAQLALAFGIAFLVTALLPALWARRQSGLGVVACPEGLARCRGRRATVLRWDEAALHVRLLQPPPLAEGYTADNLADCAVAFSLRRADGVEIRVDPLLPGVLELGRICHAERRKRLLPQVRERLGAGETVSYGPLEVSSRGVRVGDTVAGWDEVEGISVRLEGGMRGTLRVLRRGAPEGSLRIDDVAFIPDLHVFLAVADEARGG